MEGMKTNHPLCPQSVYPDVPIVFIYNSGISKVVCSVPLNELNGFNFDNEGHFLSQAFKLRKLPWETLIRNISLQIYRSE